MQKKRLLTVAALLFIFFFAGINFTYSGLLKTRTWNMIRIAYMNGYTEALELDIEEIKELKKLKRNDIPFRQKVEEAADRYMRIVEDMNR
ncbi:MAG: hypothetical protein JRJ42_10705 [Deltaproteobacteria bacterium]|nr:hypothetical protein [Deltaproteobacteria bacterium]MBW2019150.1 hypothetical protein [Deltaproteobacteria bacterium]MBW2073217.1 hypothetical protein [Deltaproteobacteria bacterium]